MSASTLVWAALLAPLLAPPTLDVKARPWFDAFTAQAVGAQVQIEGVLRDNLNQTVPGVTLRVEARGPSEQRLDLRTGPTGRFSGQVEVSGEGQYTLAALYPGGPLLGPAEATTDLYVGRVAITLKVDLPPKPSVRRPVLVPILATLPTGAPASNVPLEVTVDGAPQGTLRADRQGQAVAELPAPTPRAHTLELRVPKGPARLATEWAGQYHGARPLEVSLEFAGTAPLPPGVPVTFSGRALGAEGQGLDVLLIAGDRPVGEARLDERGRFAVAVDPEDCGAGLVRFRALTDAADPTFIDAASEVVEVEVPAPPPPSPLWTWIPLAVAGLSLLVALWRWRPRRPAPSASTEAASATPAPAPAFEWTAAQGAAPGPLHLTVSDGITGSPLEAAVVALGPDAPTPPPASATPPPGVPRRTDAHGALTLGVELTVSRVWVYRDGYAPACHACPSPPGGHAVVRLLPVRARIQQAFAEMLTAAGHPILRFGRETPQEAGEALTGRGMPATQVRELVRQVEQGCFGPTTPTLPDLAAVLTLIEGLQP